MFQKNKFDARRGFSHLAYPGKTLKAEMQARGISVMQMATVLNVSDTTVRDLFVGRRAMSTQVCIRLGIYFDTGAQFWLNLKSQYEQAVVWEKHRKQLENLPVWKKSIEGNVDGKILARS